MPWYSLAMVGASGRGVPFEGAANFAYLGIDSDPSSGPYSLGIADRAARIRIGQSTLGTGLADVRGTATEPTPKFTLSGAAHTSEGKSLALAHSGFTTPTGPSSSTMTIGLSPAATWRQVGFKMDVVDLTGDFRGLDVSRVVVDSGAGAVDVTVPDRGDCAVTVTAGAGTAIVRVPQPSTVTVIDHSAVAVRSFDGYSRDPGEPATYHRSYGQGGPNIAIVFDVAVGAVSVVTR
jgi:hypothetical protein